MEFNYEAMVFAMVCLTMKSVKIIIIIKNPRSIFYTNLQIAASSSGSRRTPPRKDE
ncbi:MAG: hypothetical protein GXO87_00665 [Chlorobi bacterium]|nr:hypothetical protein [Chlorobiota bacterium]